MQLEAIQNFDVTGSVPAITRCDSDVSGTRFGSSSASYLKILMRSATLASGTRDIEVSDLLALDASSSIHTLELFVSKSPPTHPTSTSESLRAIRSALGTNISQTANILRVSRITIYAWLANRSTPQAAKQARIDRVLAIANEWLRMSRRSLGKNLHARPNGGDSIFDLLCQEKIPAPLIRDRLAELASEPVRTKSIREIAMKLGLNPPSPEEQESALDKETGKRASFE